MVRSKVSGRVPATGILLLGASLLSGCLETGTGGLGGAFGESLVARKAVGDFSIEFANTGRAVFVAKGQQVALEPANGFCIAPESVDVGPASGFAMIGDCPATATPKDGEAQLEVPRAIPALLTVSIAEEPMFAPGSPRGAALTDLERFLATPDGLATVGRSGKADAVSIVETRAIGDALYVHVEDRDVSALPMLAERFWRAFVEVNGRMVLVSLSGFREGPLEADQMLAHLAAQVVAVREANGMAPPAAEIALAGGARVDGPTMVAMADPSDPAGGKPAPSSAPVAPERPGGGPAFAVDVAVLETEPATGIGEGGAAALAPIASLRPPEPDAAPEEEPEPSSGPPSDIAPDAAPAAPIRPR